MNPQKKSLELQVSLDGEHFASGKFPPSMHPETHVRRILAYSFSMPVVLVAGKFNFSVTPTYVIPQNLLAGELGEKLFYVTLGAGIRL